MIYQKVDGTKVNIREWTLLTVDRLKDQEGKDIDKWRVVVVMPIGTYWLTEHNAEKEAIESRDDIFTELTSE